MTDSDSEIFTVERILGHKSTKKGRFFLVKWQNYPVDDSTWEPQENLYCKHLVQQYWENPRPNISLKKIIQEEMAKKAKRSETKGTRRTSSEEEITSDEADSKATAKKIVKRPTTQETPAEEFNYRAFLKLGFAVSALIVIGFLLWSGNDLYYMEKFYARRFQNDHPQHTEH